MRLTKADIEGLSEAIKSIYAASSVSALHTVLLKKVHSLIPSNTTAITLVPADGHAIVHHNSPDLHKPVSERLWALRQFLHQHPLESAGEISGTWGATCLSDFLSRQKLHNTDLYNEFYTHVNVEYQLGVYTQRINGFRVGVSCNGDLKDFSGRDRQVLTSLAPHIIQAYNNAFAISKIRESASALEAAADVHGHGFVRVDHDGRVTDMTRLAGNLLRKYFDHPPQTKRSLPKELLAWLQNETPETIITNRNRPAIFAKGGAKLVVRVAHEGHQRILLLMEQPLPAKPGDLAPLGLRPRESEILFWMCQGKSNPEIATILGVSVRTIHKHNENIFRKLDVENRHAATLRAAPLLRNV